MASLKVGSDLRYQAAACGRIAVTVSRARPPAHAVISENSPSSAGAVRRMARSDAGAGSRRQDGYGPPGMWSHHPPKRDEPTEDHRRCRIQVCAEERGWLVLAGRIAHQRPTDRHRRDVGMVPDRGAGRDQQPALLGIIPLGDDHAGPDGLFAGQHGLECWQTAIPLPSKSDARPATATRFQSLIIVWCTPCFEASCDVVRSSRSASRATFALKYAPYRFRLPVIGFVPSHDEPSLGCCPICGDPLTTPP